MQATVTVGQATPTPGFLSEIRNRDGTLRGHLMGSCHLAKIATVLKMKEVVFERLKAASHLALEADPTGPAMKQLASRPIALPTIDIQSFKASPPEVRQQVLNAFQDALIEIVKQSMQKNLESCVSQADYVTESEVEERISCIKREMAFCERTLKELREIVKEAPDWLVKKREEKSSQLQHLQDAFVNQELLINKLKHPEAVLDIDPIAQKRAERQVLAQIASLKVEIPAEDERVAALISYGHRLLETKPWFTTFMDHELLDLFRCLHRSSQILELEEVSDIDHFVKKYEQVTLQQQLEKVSTIKDKKSALSFLQEENQQVNFTEETWLSSNREKLQLGQVTHFGFNAEIAKDLASRNARQAAHIDRFLREKEGLLFVAVGMYHLPGNEGVENLLRTHGWKITPVA